MNLIHRILLAVHEAHALYYTVARMVEYNLQFTVKQRKGMGGGRANEAGTGISGPSETERASGRVMTFG
jgi:hypothetical protein